MYMSNGCLHIEDTRFDCQMSDIVLQLLNDLLNLFPVLLQVVSLL